MKKKLNNTNFRNLLSQSLNVDEKKRMTWIEYFNQPFFKENIQDDFEEESEKEEEPVNDNLNQNDDNEDERPSQLVHIPDAAELNIEPLQLNEEEKEIIKDIDEKQEELIKDNVKKKFKS
jgi:serine/threonine protein kinase